MEQEKNKKQELTLDQTETKPEIPTIRKPLTFEFDLPCGVINSNGEVCKKIEIKPMTGRVRKQIGDVRYRNNLVKVSQMLLRETISKIEGIEKITDKLLLNMLSADRDFILLKLKEISMPKNEETILFRTNCTNTMCNVEMETEFNVKYDFSIRTIPDELNNNKNIININGNFHRIFEDEDDEFGKIIMRLQTMADQEAVVNKVNDNPLEAEHILLSRLIVEYNGNKNFSPNDFDDLSMPEINWIEELATRHNYGPNMTKEIICHNCNTKNVTTIDLLTFLFQSGRGKQTIQN